MSDLDFLIDTCLAAEDETRDPLTECPEGCMDGAHPRCCGHLVAGAYPEEPPMCCDQPDWEICEWCERNNKATISPPPKFSSEPKP